MNQTKERYKAAIAEAKKELKRISKGLKAAAARKEDINWGDVGDICYINTQLKEVGEGWKQWT